MIGMMFSKIDIKIIYEDKDLLVVDKPAGIIVFEENSCEPRAHKKTDTKLERKFLIAFLIEKYPELKSAGEAPRYGIVHRLDKDTSGILLVAKTTEALIFLQKQFSLSAEALRSKAKADAEGLEKTLEKRYITLVEGSVKNDGKLHALLARSTRDPRKQTVYEIGDAKAPKSAREAVTEWKALERYKDFTLLEVEIKTGRRHQIRCHLSYLQHPVAGDKLYGFKNSKIPEGLTRQFLHSAYLRIQLPACAGRPDGETKEFQSELPGELKKVLSNLEKI